MSPPRGRRDSRSRLKQTILLPCSLVLCTILLFAQLQLYESTPNPTPILQAEQPQVRQSSGFSEPLRYESLSQPPVVEAIENVAGGEKLPATFSEPAGPAALSEKALNELLAQQAAAGNQQPDQLGASGRVEIQPETSLAQLTAAGTLAGLRVAQDLMAQANMVENSPYQPQEGAEQSMGQIDGDEGDDGDSDDERGQSRVSSEIDQRNQPEDSNNVGDMPLHHAARRQMMANGQMQQAAETEAEAEPLNENQAPDSIESLMGADMDEADNGQTDDQSGVDEAAAQQQPAGSVPLQVVNQAAGESVMPQQNDDDEEGFNEMNLAERRDLAYAQGAKSPAMFEAPPVELSQQELMANYRDRESPMGATPELNHNLVKPMRDSLEDLNAAAGHYYGKKKKEKKMKKIIIKKKKKKKKKKKMKIKKIKVIKIKKVKKGKKHYPKKHYHKKHHHVHDHGKYYMYAKVPKKKAWEFGFKKGNKKHWVSRHEKGYKNKFKTKVKWADKKSKGKGFHVWDYNHHDKKKKKGHY